MLPPTDELPLHLLTGRERQVVALAIEGRTDAQIAHALDISPSSVNTYWVRIREKVGPLTRTEIVARSLQQTHRAQVLALEEENRALADRERQAREALARTEAVLGETHAPPCAALALEHLGVAALVIRASGIILYANPQAEHFMRAAPGDLQGLHTWDLTIPEKREEWSVAHDAFFADPRAQRTVGGLNAAQYVVRGDGTCERVIFAASRFGCAEGELAVVILRDFAGGNETFVRSSCEPMTSW